MPTNTKQPKEIYPIRFRISPNGVCNRDIYTDMPPKLTILSKKPDDPVRFVIEVDGRKCPFDSQKVYGNGGTAYYDAIYFESDKTDGYKFSVIDRDFAYKTLKDVKPLLAKLKREIALAAKRNTAYHAKLAADHEAYEKQQRYQQYLKLKAEFEPETKETK